MPGGKRLIPPELTPEQRKAATAKAIAVRRARAEVKQRLRSGRLTFGEVLEMADEDPIVGGMRLRTVLESLPRVGPVTAERLMRRLGIAESRRVQGILDKTHQKKGLLDALP